MMPESPKPTCGNCEAWQGGECTNCLSPTRPDDACEHHVREPGKKTDAITGRNPFSGHMKGLVVNPQAIKDGYLDLRPVTLYHADGSSSTLQQVLITPKGFAILERHAAEM